VIFFQKNNKDITILYKNHTLNIRIQLM